MSADETKGVMQEIHDATTARGGYVATGVGDKGWCIEWWMPELVTPSWTQVAHETIESAMDEALERIRATLEATR